MVFKKGNHPNTEFKKGHPKYGNGGFKKGQVSPNKGKILSEETKKLMKENHRSKKGFNPPMLGKHQSEYQKKRCSETHKGKIVSEETKEKVRKARLKQKIPNKFTSIELKIKSFLDELHIPYKTHKAIMGITQPDFFIEPNICIYCDGDYWHNILIAIERDKRINEILNFGGFKVIRLWEHDIKKLEIGNFKEKLIFK